MLWAWNKPSIKDELSLPRFQKLMIIMFLALSEEGFYERSDLWDALTGSFHAQIIQKQRSRLMRLLIFAHLLHQVLEISVGLSRASMKPS